MSVLRLIVLFAGLFFLFVSLILLVVGPSMLLQPHRRTVDWYRHFTSVLHPAHLGMRYEERTVYSAEGIALSSWLLRPPCNPVGTVIILHGVSESKIAPLPLAKHLYDHCFNVFLYDSRRHGDSGGNFCTQPAAGAANAELLWQSGETKSPSGFSPDGRILLVNRWMNPGFRGDLWALPMTGDRKPFPLIESAAFNEHSAVFSPSGRFIAYVSNDSGVSQVYAQPFPPTGARVQLTTGNGRSPTRTSDGRTVLYSTMVDESSARTFVAETAFMAVDVTTSESTVRAGSPRVLFTQRHIGGGLNAFAMDPSCRRFLLVVPDQQALAPITVVLNWPSLLSKK